MSSDAAQRILNLNERATSADPTRLQDLAHRMVQESLWAAVNQDRGESGVIYGLQVTVDAGARQVTVGLGLALINDTGKSHPDSKQRWIEVTAPVTANIPAASGFDRWDVIEIAPSTSVTINTSVDVFDETIPPDGAFAPSVLDKERQSVPTVTVRQGADNSPNPPNFPAGASGQIPLAYLFVNSAGTVTGGVDGIVQCRPMLIPAGALDASETHAPPFDDGMAWAQGGGIVISSGAPGDVLLYQCRGRFQDTRIGFSLGTNAKIDVTNSNSWSNGAKAASDKPVYAWTFPIPYPAGYSSLAGREFIPGSSVRTHFFCVDDAAAGQRNCGVIVSDLRVPATDTQAASPQGGGTGTLTINDWPFRSGSTKATVDTDRCVYLGAFDWDFSDDAAEAQVYLGGGRVALQGRSGFNDVLNMGAEAIWHSFDPRSSSTADQGNIPLTAHVLHALIAYGGDSGSSDDENQIKFRDSETIAALNVIKGMSWVTTSSQGVSVPGEPIDFVVNTASGATIEARYERAQADVAEFVVRVVGYTDKILSMR